LPVKKLPDADPPREYTLFEGISPGGFFFQGRISEKDVEFRF
jgi:hypothetical protein